MSASPGPSGTQSAVQSECPVCDKSFPTTAIEVHVNRCIFLNTQTDECASGTISSSSVASSSSGVVVSASKDANKRNFGVFESRSPGEVKKPKLNNGPSTSKYHSRVESSTVIDLDVDDADEVGSNKLPHTIFFLIFF